MATPSRSNAVSTPKNNPSGTPQNIHASPRSAVPSVPGRPAAGKSPAGKTPAGHSHHVSTSSQPSSTPIAVPNTADDTIAYSSPSAALIASLTGQGMTPLQSGEDGLGISNILPDSQGLQSTTIRDPATERLRRLQEIVEALRTRVAGKGITREGIERLAQVNGFELGPQDHSITIAGHNCVDLEIGFDRTNRDRVRMLELKVNMSDPGEDPEFQRQASDILKNTLQQTSADEYAPWKSLDGFAANLEYLGKMDRLSTNINCFAAIRGLYDCFQTIWEEENKRLSWKHSLHHVCQGAAGRPYIDRPDQLGLSIDYWHDKHELIVTEPHVQPNRQDASDPPSRWSAIMSCEPGLPSISKNHDWLSTEVLINEDVSESNGAGQKSVKPAWKHGPADDPDAVESLEGLLDTPNVRFACKLSPPVLLPLNTLLILNANSPSNEVDQTKMMTYQQELERTRPSSVVAGTTGAPSARSFRQITTYDSAGRPKHRKHSYAFYTNLPLWCYPLDKFYFNHPRQFIEKIPILRQYAMVWALLKTVMSGGSPPASVDTEEPHPSISLASGIKPSAPIIKSNRPQKRNNQNLKKAKQSRVVNANALPSHDTQNIDITLDTSNTVEPFKVRLNLIVPLTRAPHFLSLLVDVLPNGELLASSVTPKLSGEEMGRKLTRVLRLGEDLGVLAEWAVECMK